MTDNVTLPDLPRACVTYADHSYPAYSAKQMQEYAAQALAEGELIGARLMQWQPIETAPRDGDYLLTCRIGDPAPWFGGYRIDGYAEPPEVAQWIDAGDCWMAIQRPHDQWDPTHWMPLPAAPEAIVEGGA